MGRTKDEETGMTLVDRFRGAVKGMPRRLVFGPLARPCCPG
ncbi:hypothetical protein I553_10505 [Mycobacterium xenopi 4042]|uniref:Uncharacterized protein n=1 Tax=Mycobacterium xenopi 4042 TaxID=1299334 RepID=X8DJ30_MYCXE|nr:hypothetical protein I553_10505 [Mycobacterium xenopi 4042]